MLHPELVLIPGKDLMDVEQKLQILDIGYKVWCQHIQEKTQLLIGSYTWPNEPNKIIYLDDILEGLKLPFFKPEPVELEWDIKNCIPQSWSFDIWETNLIDDINCWFSTNPSMVLTNNEKMFMTNIINNCINVETKIMKIYTHALKPTFLHPQIQTLLNICTFRKQSHINMWYNVKEKFGLSFKNPILFENEYPLIILELVICSLSTIITKEEILEPAPIEYLTYFTSRGHIGQFIKLVERRNKESKENAQLLKILLGQVEKMYPFLNESINYIYKYNQESAIYINNVLKKTV